MGGHRALEQPVDAVDEGHGGGDVEQEGQGQTGEEARLPEPAPQQRQRGGHEDNEQRRPQQLGRPRPLPHPGQQPGAVEEVDGARHPERRHRCEGANHHRRPPPARPQRRERRGEDDRRPHQPAADDRRAQAGHRIAQDAVRLLPVHVGAEVRLALARLHHEGVVQEHRRQVGPETGDQPGEEPRDRRQVGAEGDHVGWHDEGLSVTGVAVAEGPEDAEPGAVGLELEDHGVAGADVEEPGGLRRLPHG